jgi:hypothetical protein
MRNVLVLGSFAAGVLVLGAYAPAGAFVPIQTEVANAAAAESDIIQVKRGKTARPPGWDRGRKVGWRGGRKPPGQRR